MFRRWLLPASPGRHGRGSCRRLLAAAWGARRLGGGGPCCAAPGPGQRRPRLGAAAPRGQLWRWANELGRHSATEASQATLASVVPVFAVVKFDKEGNITSFERKKTELYQELGLQARDLRFQHLMSIATRNNRIIIRMEFLKAVVTPEFLLILDYRSLNMEHWLFQELASQLSGEGQLVTYSLPFEFRAIEAILQYWISNLQGRLNVLQPQIIETLEALVDPKLLSVDRSKLHILLQNGKSLSELETDLKVFKETILKILDEEELIEELCLTKWTDPQVFEESMSGIDHAEEMELLLENYYRQAEDLTNEARELRVLIDDSESIIFINLDSGELPREAFGARTPSGGQQELRRGGCGMPQSRLCFTVQHFLTLCFFVSILASHRNVMMRLNLQLTMGTFSLSLFGLIGVAFGMNLESSFEEDHRAFWLVTGIMFLGSGLIWRRLLSFLGRHLEPSLPPQVPTLLKKTHPTAGRIEVKNDLKTEAFMSSRSTLTNR